MDATFDGTAVRAGPAAREQFYDARGYGRPADGDLVLAPVEAAHLLFRGDLEAVVDRRPAGDGRRLGFRDVLASTAVSEVDFFVYKDLRDRGFYLSPTAHARDGGDGPADFLVYPRGQGPWDGEVAYRVRAVSERAGVDTGRLRALTDGEGTGVLAVVDEESELTYLELDSPAPSGSSAETGALPETAGNLLADRVLVWDPPGALYGEAFYGQPLDDGVQLSLVEAAFLARADRLAVEGGAEAVVARGREVEGERFDRRLRAYSALRSAGVVPKTGFKFGADFRTYDDVTDVEDLGHSGRLVRVLAPDHTFAPRDLALDVRLAGGVRKRMVYALAGDRVSWLGVGRLTP